MNDDGEGSTRNGRADSPYLVLWSRYLAGEPLTDSEAQQLRSAVRDQPEFRRWLHEERWLDCLLRFELEGPLSSQLFVEQVLKRCRSSEASTTQMAVESEACAARSGLPADLERATFPTARRSMDAVVHDPSQSVPRLEREQAGTTEADSPRGRRSRRRPISWWVIAAGAALSVLGLGVWYRGELARIADRLRPIDQPVKGRELRDPQSGTLDEGMELPEVSAVIADHLKQRPEGQPSGMGLAEPARDSIEPTPPGVGPIYATVTDEVLVEGSTPWGLGRALGANSYDISSGELQFTMSQGAVVTVYAPARIELNSENSLTLWFGELSAVVPTEAVGFVVNTPAVVITDWGTVFDVAVSQAGATEIEVREGAVTVVSREPQNRQEWYLDAEENYALTFFRPESWSGDSATLNGPPVPSLGYPIASLAKNHAGTVSGVLSFDGRTLKFDDETAFLRVREQVFRQMDEAPEALAANWHQFVESLGNSPQPKGTLSVNGMAIDFQNLNEALRLQDQLRQWAANPQELTPENDPVHLAQPRPKPTEAPRRNPLQSGRFVGSLLINGQQRRFETVEEYQAAIRELLGPAAAFGFEWIRP